jgi:hypothetical protein
VSVARPGSGTARGSAAAAAQGFRRLAGRAGAALASGAVVLALVERVPLGVAVGRGALLFVACVALGRGMQRLASSRSWPGPAEERTTPQGSTEEPRPESRGKRAA